MPGKHSKFVETPTPFGGERTYWKVGKEDLERLVGLRGRRPKDAVWVERVLSDELTLVIQTVRVTTKISLQQEFPSQRRVRQTKEEDEVVAVMNLVIPAGTKLSFQLQERSPSALLAYVPDVRLESSGPLVQLNILISGRIVPRGYRSTRL